MARDLILVFGGCGESGFAAIVIRGFSYVIY